MYIANLNNNNINKKAVSLYETKDLTQHYFPYEYRSISVNQSEQIMIKYLYLSYRIKTDIKYW